MTGGPVAVQSLFLCLRMLYLGADPNKREIFAAAPPLVLLLRRALVNPHTFFPASDSPHSLLSRVPHIHMPRDMASSAFVASTCTWKMERFLGPRLSVQLSVATTWPFEY